jgi:acetolactate decarboxylase
MKEHFLVVFINLFSILVFSQEVHTSGKAKNVMMGIDLSATVALDTLLVKQHLYALGPVDDLQGEITVFDGEVYAAEVTNKRKRNVKFQEAEGLKAPFLVYAYVPEWKTYSVEVDLQNLKDLENIVDSLGRAHGYTKTDAFPFLVEATFLEVEYHIIKRNKREKQHSHEAHNAAKIHFSNCLIPANLVGFYSRHHEGVFTHKGQFTHVHFLPKDRRITGHLDKLNHTGTVLFSLPVVSRNN